MLLDNKIEALKKIVPDNQNNPEYTKKNSEILISTIEMAEALNQRDDTKYRHLCKENVADRENPGKYKICNFGFIFHLP